MGCENFGDGGIFLLRIAAPRTFIAAPAAEARGLEANQGDCALCSARVLVVGLSLPHIVADAIDGGA